MLQTGDRPRFRDNQSGEKTACLHWKREERKQRKNWAERLKHRSHELGITAEFSEYVEMMETYLLTLERRVLRLEKEHQLHDKDVLDMEL